MGEGEGLRVTLKRVILDRSGLPKNSLDTSLNLRIKQKQPPELFYEVFLEISQNSQEACNSIKKETSVQMFSCEFCEISKNNFLTEHLWTTAPILNAVKNENQKGTCEQKMKEMLETFQYIFYSYYYIIHSKSQSNV